MLKHAHIGKIGIAVTAGMLVVLLLFLTGAVTGFIQPLPAAAYETRLFRTDAVHTLDIAMDDWDAFLETCVEEQYSVCTVTIDGEPFGNVGIRAKGNSSLASVARVGNDRYSFKVEFDQYNEGSLYYGLDKLCLNNLFSDSTYLKDYITYEMMRSQGVPAPLCSFVQITVNGEDWGLYLAVEGVEDAFLKRNFGADHGALYKPEGAGINENEAEGAVPAVEFRPEQGVDVAQAPRNWLSSPALRLQYIDDNPESYATIFDNAKTKVTDSDQERLIQSLETLGSGTDIEDVVDRDAVIRYLVVHDFVRNGDSYTGTMVHNYYLYEEDGRLTMIPWDYNMAFGLFSERGPQATSDRTGGATAEVNAPIDSPVTGSATGDRPMIAWIFSDVSALEQYHEAYATFLIEWFDSGRFETLLQETMERIAPYVESDPTAFCSYTVFETGVSMLQRFCTLRAESVSGQLDGSIPSTAEGQEADRSTFINASTVSLEAMGSVSAGMPNDAPNDRLPAGNRRLPGARPAQQPTRAGPAAAESPGIPAVLFLASLTLLAGGVAVVLKRRSS